MPPAKEYNREEIAEDLIKWAKKDDSINLNAFCAYHPKGPFPPRRISDWAKENEVFCLAYESAKTFLAVRREQKLSKGKLHVKAYDLNATVYDQFLKDEKRAQAEYEASLNQGSSNAQSEQVALAIAQGKKLNDNSRTLPQTNQSPSGEHSTD